MTTTTTEEDEVIELSPAQQLEKAIGNAIKIAALLYGELLPPRTLHFFVFVNSENEMRLAQEAIAERPDAPRYLQFSILSTTAPSSVRGRSAVGYFAFPDFTFTRDGEAMLERTMAWCRYVLSILLSSVNLKKDVIV